MNNSCPDFGTVEVGGVETGLDLFSSYSEKEHAMCSPLDRDEQMFYALVTVLWLVCMAAAASWFVGELYASLRAARSRARMRNAVPESLADVGTAFGVTRGNDSGPAS